MQATVLCSRRSHIGVPHEESEERGRMNARQDKATSSDRAGIPPERGTRVFLASLAAMAGVVVASSCCLPILPFVLAAGFAGSSAFLTAARPYLLGASVCLIAYGFYEAKRASQCHRRVSYVALCLLWLSTISVVISAESCGSYGCIQRG
jgi:hypothetical protein